MLHRKEHKIVKIIRQPVAGKLLTDGDKAALLLGEPESEDQVYLAYALVTQGPGYQLLPASLLDDWGNEIDKLALYHWIRENGLRFPRAEVFGYSPTGKNEQYFLRDLELFARYPVYAFAESDAPVTSGLRLQAILLPEPGADAQPIDPPDEVDSPLREARVSWWRVRPEQADLAFLE
jgi:hypothetical protein